MPQVSGTIPNLIGGVEQRPKDIRALNTAALLNNVWLSPTLGMVTRPNTKYVGTFNVDKGADDFVGLHAISKSSGNYIIGHINGALYVMDLSDGSLETVNTTGTPYTYVNSGSDAENLGFLTVGDTTFIYNKSVTVTATTTAESGTTGITEDSIVRLNPNLHSTIWVKQRAQTNIYRVYLNGTSVSSKETGSSYSGDQEEIMDDIYTDLDVPTEFASKTRASTSVASVELALETDWITTDSDGETMASYNDYVDEFADLTKTDREGRMVLIKQESGDASDDYWVWMNKGEWTETYGWNSYEIPDAETMPHVLVDNLDGSWTLQEHEWLGRDSGDTESNISPTFINNKINNMFIHKGRMCVLADENFMASEVGNFENFYRTTCTQLLDDDPINIASPESRGGELYHAVEFNDSLLLFSKFDQFKVEGDAEGLFSPNTVNIKRVNAYNASPSVKPIPVGPNIIFADDFQNRRYGQVQEYQVERVFGREVALSITDSVPEYIPSGIYSMIQSSTNKIASVLSKGNRNQIYNYNYYYNNEGKVQAAWNKWLIEGEVYGATFVEDKLYIIIRYDSKMTVHELIFEENLDLTFDTDSILLDYRVEHSDLTVTYTGGNTEVTLPYAADLSQRLVCDPGDTDGTLDPGETLVPDDATGLVLTFNDVDLTSTDFSIGFPFTLTWEMNPFFMRDDNSVPIQDGRLQLSAVTIMFNNSNNFTVTVTPAQRDPVETSLSANTGLRVGRPTSTVGNLEFFDGEFRFPAYGNADKTKILVEAETPWRVGFTTVEWYAMWRPKRRR